MQRHRNAILLLALTYMHHVVQASSGLTGSGKVVSHPTRDRHRVPYLDDGPGVAMPRCPHTVIEDGHQKQRAAARRAVLGLLRAAAQAERQPQRRAKRACSPSEARLALGLGQACQRFA